MSIGPRILGHATDLVFAGLFSRSIPAGVTQAESVESLRQRGDDTLAGMLANMDHVVPGQGVDFAAVGDVLMLVLVVYAAAAVLGWLQGMVLNRVVQNTVYRMRQDVEDKINRLPLNYFDRSAARRAAQPGHQRHRQRQPDAAADDEPADDLAAHRRRRARR